MRGTVISEAQARGALRAWRRGVGARAVYVPALSRGSAR